MAESTASQIYKVLKRRILTGEIPPEQQLIETALAEELQVSRTPIREAIALLKKDRLVIPVQSGGVITRDVSLELKDILGVRKALETYAIKTAIDLISPAQIAELERICEQSRTLETGDIEARARLNTEFHERIVAAARNPRLYQMWLECREFFLIAQQSYAPDFGGFHQHDSILDAVRQRDKALAEKLINEHLDLSLASVMNAHAGVMRRDRLTT